MEKVKWGRACTRIARRVWYTVLLLATWRHVYSKTKCSMNFDTRQEEKNQLILDGSCTVWILGKHHESWSWMFLTIICRMISMGNDCLSIRIKIRNSACQDKSLKRVNWEVENWSWSWRLFGLYCSYTSRRRCRGMATRGLNGRKWNFFLFKFEYMSSITITVTTFLFSF